MSFGCHPEVLIRDIGPGCLSSDPRLSAHFEEADSVEGSPGPGTGPVVGSVLAPDNGLGGSAWCSLTRGSLAVAGGLGGSCVWRLHCYPEGLCVLQSTIHISPMKLLCDIFHERTRAQGMQPYPKVAQCTSVGRDSIYSWWGRGYNRDLVGALSRALGPWSGLCGSWRGVGH